MTRILILLTLPAPVRQTYLERLRAAFPAERIELADHASRVDPWIAEAEVLITFGPMLADGVLERAPRLRWVQALGTGVDGIVDRLAGRPEVLVTNMHGIHGEAMSEAALMLMLAMARGLPRSLAAQARQAWERFPASLISGRTVGIVGVGAIAAALAPRCRALGMRVLGISSVPREVDGFDAVVPRDRMLAVLPRIDYLVLLTPYSNATRGMIGATELAALPGGARLVNLARGGVLDEDALLAALRSGALAGAALDVFGVEPLPPGHPLWSAPNLIVTTHQGGFFDGYPDRALPVIEHNLRAFLAGDPGSMRNRVAREGA